MVYWRTNWVELTFSLWIEENICNKKSVYKQEVYWWKCRCHSLTMTFIKRLTSLFSLHMCCPRNETKSNRVTKITNCSLLFYIFLWNIMNVILLICLRKDLLYSIYDSVHSITNQFDRWEVLILNSCEYCLKNETLYILLNPLVYSIFYSQSNFYIRAWCIRNMLSG